jgi:hypothetical protein
MATGITKRKPLPLQRWLRGMGLLGPRGDEDPQDLRP